MTLFRTADESENLTAEDHTAAADLALEIAETCMPYEPHIQATALATILAANLAFGADHGCELSALLDRTMDVIRERAEGLLQNGRPVGRA